MSWQTFLVFINGEYVGSHQGLTKQEAIQAFSAKFPSHKLEVL
jgi:hypothetical protein